ncbi:MAG: acetylornithine transaminase, partial [Pseudomonadales bacterium]
MNTYNRLPVSFTHGEGAWLFDADGNRYLDALTGVGVNSLGHAHPAVTRAIQEQAGKLMHTSNIYQIELQEKLGDALAGVSSMESMFFANSGAEANEAAIKIARLYGHREKNIDSPAIIVLDGAFHGRTLATLTATGNRKIQAGFEPLVSGFVRAPFNDVTAISNIAHNNPSLVAVLLEPIQGEGGILSPTPDYLPQLRVLCDQHGWLLMLDEVQTGNGRTGSYFNYLQHGLLPDVVTTAKGLGNGIPIGVCMARGVAAAVMHPGNHGTTFGGNPLACAVALTVVETIVQEQLADRAAALGERIRDNFRSSL